MSAPAPVIANVARTALGWIDDNADWLPAGFALQVAGTAEVVWYSQGINETATKVAATLTGRLGEGTVSDDLWVGTSWPAEGDRPALVIYGVAVVAA